jgi:hypothetical protein
MGLDLSAVTVPVSGQQGATSALSTGEIAEWRTFRARVNAPVQRAGRLS